MSDIGSFITVALLVVGILAFLVSAITEVVKGVIKQIPTDIVVVALSIGLSIAAYFGYLEYAAREFVVYELGGVIIGGFIVAFVAMYGWQKLSELFNRFRAPTDISSNLTGLNGSVITTGTALLSAEPQGEAKVVADVPESESSQA